MHMYEVQEVHLKNAWRAPQKVTRLLPATRGIIRKVQERQHQEESATEQTEAQYLQAQHDAAEANTSTAE